MNANGSMGAQTEDRGTMGLTHRVSRRFSLRAMFLLTLLAGIYLSVDNLTRTRGKQQVARWLNDQQSVGTLLHEGPLLFSSGIVRSEIVAGKVVVHSKKKYFFWFLGPIVQLPFESHYVDTVRPGYLLSDIEKRRMR